MLTILVIAALLALIASRVTHAGRHMSPAEAWARGTFATCVRYRESHNGQDPNADGNLYGLEGMNVPWRFARLGGTYSWAASVPRRVQDRLAYLLWVRDGDSPWSRWDGC